MDPIIKHKIDIIQDIIKVHLDTVQELAPVMGNYISVRNKADKIERAWHKYHSENIISQYWNCDGTTIIKTSYIGNGIVVSTNFYPASASRKYITLEHYNSTLSKNCHVSSRDYFEIGTAVDNEQYNFEELIDEDEYFNLSMIHTLPSYKCYLLAKELYKTLPDSLYVSYRELSDDIKMETLYDR